MIQPKMSEKETITVVVGRFESLVGYGLKRVLSADPCVRILATDLDGAGLERVVAQPDDVEFAQTITQQQPTVVVLGDAVDYALLTRLKACQPAMGILVLAHDPARLYGTLLLAAGATCLAQNASDADLIAAIRVAAQGEPTFFCVDGDRVARRGPPAGLLSPRETKVFEHLCQGKSYAEIGGALQIGPETVRSHTLSICRKLKVKNKRELIGMSPPARLDRPM